ncbi:MAG: uncharacterized protein A8A55_3105 [Amphiamblys sp. WSBS2006]|nr:MAG: uncharacterized protein A8A55_3105 [Amphiamblys sp. WSBS2006]
MAKKMMKTPRYSFSLFAREHIISSAWTVWMAGRQNKNKIRCSFCNKYATFAMDEYKKDLAQDSFCLRNPLPNRVVVLSEKTTVHLENVGISEKLFFALLTKTRIRASDSPSPSFNTETTKTVSKNTPWEETIRSAWREDMAVI